jgi:hypothetical protein
VISSGAQVARLVAGSLQALGPAAPMAFTWNQYCVPLVRRVAATRGGDEARTDVVEDVRDGLELAAHFARGQR